MYSMIQIQDMNELKAFGQLVKDARQNRGMEAKDLAPLLGVSTTKISNIENGYGKTPPDADLVRAIETSLGIPRRRLLVALGYIDEEESPDGESEALSAVRAILEGRDFTDKQVRQLATMVRGMVEMMEG